MNTLFNRGTVLTSVHLTLRTKFTNLIMDIYTDKCPYCGTYISIPKATRCPGCSSSIYSYGLRYYRYYPSLESVEAAKKADAAYLAYWNSEDGIKRKKEFEKIEQERLEQEREKEREKLEKNKREDMIAALCNWLGIFPFFCFPFVALIWSTFSRDWSIFEYYFEYYFWPSLGMFIISSIYLIWKGET